MDLIKRELERLRMLSALVTARDALRSSASRSRRGESPEMIRALVVTDQVLHHHGLAPVESGNA